MANTNVSLVIHKKEDIRLENLPVQEPGPGEAQVTPKNVGICGSDLSLYNKGGIGDWVVERPVALGHEASGVVCKLGEGVTSLKVGDKVALEPVFSCHKCRCCKAGRHNVCSAVEVIGIPHRTGALTRWLVHPEHMCHKLPDNLSTEEGALVEPLSVAVHACRRADIMIGSKVLVCGAGPIGLLTMMVAKSCGAAFVCITDIVQKRLDLAKKLGADIVLNVASSDPKATAKQIVDAMGENPPVAIECSGAPASINAAIYSTLSGGCVVLVGLGPAEITINVHEAILREVDIRGSFAYVNCFPAAIALIASGKVNVKPLVTHVFEMKDFKQAFTVFSKAEGVKVQFKCD